MKLFYIKWTVNNIFIGIKIFITWNLIFLKAMIIRISPFTFRSASKAFAVKYGLQNTEDASISGMLKKHPINSRLKNEENYPFHPFVLRTSNICLQHVHSEFLFARCLWFFLWPSRYSFQFRIYWTHVCFWFPIAFNKPRNHCCCILNFPILILIIAICISLTSYIET